MPNECNVPSRTIFTGDNLDILRGINSDCVDLIYLDPPFNSNQTYAAPLDSEAKGAEFDDVWTLGDMKEGGRRCHRSADRYCRWASIPGAVRFRRTLMKVR